MTDTNMTNMEWATLIDRYIEGTLTEEEGALLLAEVESSPEQKRRFGESVLLDFMLDEKYRLVRNVADAGEPQSPDLSWDELVRLQNAEKPYHVEEKYWRKVRFGVRRPPLTLENKTDHHYALFHQLRKCVFPTRQDWNESIAPVFAPILFLVALGMGCLIFWDQSSRNQVHHEEAVPAMARVNETIKAVWARDAAEYHRGQLVDESRFQLVSGLVQLEMKNGTTLVLEGPADLTVNSPMEAFCQSGRVSVQVTPEAQGYKIVTPHGEVVDQSTEFFVQVTPNETLAQTVKGHVDYYSPSKKKFPLREKEAIRYSLSAREPQLFKGTDQDYISRDIFTCKRREKNQWILANREQENARLDGDPHLIAHFLFDDSMRQNIRNQAVMYADQIPLAKREGTTLVDGSIDGSRAVHFQDKKDQLVFNSDLELENATLITRVRLGSQLQLGNVLFSSKDRDEEPGTILWQVSKLGFQQLQISTEHQNMSQTYNSMPFFEVGTQGIWCLLAMTLDREEKEIRFYVNGRMISRQEWTTPTPIILRDNVLGNTHLNRTGTNRCLNGDMEMFMVFDRAMTGKEIGNYMVKTTSEKM